jgi:pimeloyl-ACP methyl ester carboxylesterase
LAVTTEMQVRDAFITLNGLRFHYRDWGAPDAPPIVLLHGGGVQAHCWDTFAAAMADRYRLLALDQRGHGQTAWADDYALDRWVEDVEAFVAALALPPFSLVAHSMGAWVAERYTARHPEAVRRLVIVDQAPWDPSESEGIRPMRGWQLVHDDIQDIIRYLRPFFPHTPEELLRESSRHNYRRRDDGRWTMLWDPKLRDGGGPSAGDDTWIWQALAAIACPTLLVVGAEGNLARTGRARVQRMVETIPDCRMVEIPVSAHNVPFDNPDAFLAAMQDFLGSTD